MGIERWERHGLLAGPVFVVLLIVSVLLPGEPPAPGDPAAEIRTFFIDNAGRIEAAGIVNVVSVLFALWWVASLWRAMTKAEYGKSRLVLVAALALSFGGAMAGVAQSLWAATALMGTEISPETARFAYILAGTIFGVASIAFGTMCAAIAVLALRQQFMPRWVGYLAGLSGVTWLLSGGTAGSTADWLVVPQVVAFLTMLVLILGITAVLWRSKTTALDLTDAAGVEAHAAAAESVPQGA